MEPYVRQVLEKMDKRQITTEEAVEALLVEFGRGSVQLIVDENVYDIRAFMVGMGYTAKPVDPEAKDEDILPTLRGHVFITNNEKHFSPDVLRKRFRYSLISVPLRDAKQTAEAVKNVLMKYELDTYLGRWVKLGWDNNRSRWVETVYDLGKQTPATLLYPTMAEPTLNPTEAPDGFVAVPWGATLQAERKTNRRTDMNPKTAPRRKHNTQNAEKEKDLLPTVHPAIDEKDLTALKRLVADEFARLRGLPTAPATEPHGLKEATKSFPAPAPVSDRTESEVEGELCTLKSQLHVLDDLLTQLTARLEPVVVPVPELESPGKEAECGCRLSTVLREHRYLVVRSANNVRRLLNGLRL